MARHIHMPEFMSSKRAKLAAAGLAGVVIATTAASSAMAMAPTAEDGAVTAAMSAPAHGTAQERPFGQDEQRAAAQLEHAVRAVGQHQAAAPSTPKQVAHVMLGNYGWKDSEFACLDSLWTKESNWEPSAANPSSGAFGIPQALPSSQMASAGSDWQTNPATQIKWGLTYIQGRYGSPCGAWAHETSAGWY